MRNILIIALIIFLYFSISLVSKANAEIDISMPNGGEVYTSGQLLEIKFKNNISDEVNVYLWNGKSKQFIFIGNTNNSTLIWEIPKELEGNKFRIKIISVKGSEFNNYGYSENFFCINRKKNEQLKKDSNLGSYQKHDLNVKVFPNPSSEILSIEVDKEKSLTYEIININGIKVSDGTIDKYAYLSLSDFSSGTYFIKINNDTDVILKKFIVKR